MKTIKGDILEFPKGITAICQGCNTFNVFGIGLAKQIKDTFPQAYEADCLAALNNTNKLGEISYARVSTENGKKWIFNLYQQNSFGRDIGGMPSLKYHAFREAMKKMRDCCEKLDLVVGIPYRIGCGYAGGDWRVVKGIIHDIWDGYHKEVYIVNNEQ